MSGPPGRAIVKAQYHSCACCRLSRCRRRYRQWDQAPQQLSEIRQAQAPAKPRDRRKAARLCVRGLFFRGAAGPGSAARTTASRPRCAPHSCPAPSPAWPPQRHVDVPVAASRPGSSGNTDFDPSAFHDKHSPAQESLVSAHSAAPSLIGLQTRTRRAPLGLAMDKSPVADFIPTPTHPPPVQPGPVAAGRGHPPRHPRGHEACASPWFRPP